MCITPSLKSSDLEGVCEWDMVCETLSHQIELTYVLSQSVVRPSNSVISEERLPEIEGENSAKILKCCLSVYNRSISKILIFLECPEHPKHLHTVYQERRAHPTFCRN